MKRVGGQGRQASMLLLCLRFSAKDWETEVKEAKCIAQRWDRWDVEFRR